MRCDLAAVRVFLLMSCVTSHTSAQSVNAPPQPSVSAAFEALLDDMACRQQKSGRMDCEFRVGNGVRFVIAGVGQEDVMVSFIQADSGAAYIASMVPLHGCVVVKPLRAGDATRAAGIPASDSVATFAFVSPRTGKVYRNWQTCLSATRGDGPKAPAKSDSTLKQDTTRKAGPMTKAPAGKAPPTKPSR